MQISGLVTAGALLFVAGILDVQAQPASPAGAAASGNAADDPMAAYQAGDYARARQLLEPRARAGDALAQIMMGDMYRNGNGVPRDDHIAYTWIRKAADQGDARGQAALAALMQAGRGTPRDEAGALAWLQKSAQQGYATGQVALGFAYLNGRGTPKDENKAVLWLRKAAAQGNTDAADMLKQLGR